MKSSLAVVILFLISLPIVARGQSSVSASDEQEIKNLEQGWVQSVLKDGAASVDRYEADDIVTTDPSGRVTDKAQDKSDLASGDLKFQSMEISDLTVHVYGNTAVATGTNRVKGTYKGQDLSGTYRYSDTWVKRNGKWQAVASQSTKVQ
jgi:ketosteroid isomerase-like protein